MKVTPLPSAAGGPGWFTIALPPGAAGQWCRVTITLSFAGPWWAKLLAEDHARGQVVREAFLGPRTARRPDTRALLLHIPQFADRLLLTLFTLTPTLTPAPAPTATLHILTRAQATRRLLAAGWRDLPASLRGSPAGLSGRVRTAIGQAPARAGEAPGYDIWLRLYDQWSAADRHMLRRHAARHPPVAIEILLIGQQDAIPPALLAAQWLQPVRASLAHAGWERLPDTWLLPLRAGERLAPHALACFALAIARHPAARGIYADADILTPAGRHTPILKPPSDPWLHATGLLAQGACVFHPAVAAPAPGTDAAAYRRIMAGTIASDTFLHVPFILSHIANPPPLAPVQTVNVRPSSTKMISLLVPSSCRHAHVLRCLRRLLAITEPGNFEILLAVSAVDPHDRRQHAILQRLRALPRVRILDLQMQAFNYAAVNNAAARHAQGDLLLLLNDDVVPIRPDWLRQMAAFIASADHQADIVGARLLYGNGLVQHAGVIMGLANLCEHAFRLTERKDAGPHGIARMTRQVSAVTAACMLVRRGLWQRLGGMDESFAIALNDVDFCLRAGQAGARIVFAAAVELYHYESLSLGRHYQGTRAGLEAREVQRLRGKWQSVIAADPFYNPQASTEPGREFAPAFPPRLTPHSWMAAEVPAQR